MSDSPSEEGPLDSWLRGLPDVPLEPSSGDLPEPMLSFDEAWSAARMAAEAAVRPPADPALPASLKTLVEAWHPRMTTEITASPHWHETRPELGRLRERLGRSNPGAETASEELDHAGIFVRDTLMDCSDHLAELLLAGSQRRTAVDDAPTLSERRQALLRLLLWLEGL